MGPNFRRRFGFPPRGRLLVHAGLHKTGSTAIQQALAEAAPVLAGQGVLVPGCGRPPGLDGHHNLAWQLAGDPRFDPRHGTLADLAAILRGHRGDALISSEDFEALLTAPAAWAALQAAAGPRAVQVLVYLRDQADYAVSLFLELQQHGMRRSAARYLDQIATDGRVRVRGWLFQFDFVPLLRPNGPRYWLRAYPGSGGSVADFWRALALPGPPPPERHANLRLPLAASLAAYCARQSGRDPAQLAKALSALLGPGWPAAAVTLGPAMRARFATRFAPGNAAVRATHGVILTANGGDPPRPDAPLSPDLALLFSPLVASVIESRIAGRCSAQETRAALAGAGLPL